MINTLNFNYLSADEISKIHRAGVSILARYGIKVDDYEVVRLMEENGCRVSGGRVLISEELITQMQAALPKTLTLSMPYGESLTLKNGEVFTHVGGGVPWVIDDICGKKRDAVTADLIDATKLINQLSYINVHTPPAYITDVDKRVAGLTQLAVSLKHSRKPTFAFSSTDVTEAKYSAELFKLLGGTSEKPVGIAIYSVQSPLYFSKELTDVMKVLIGAGVPACACSAPVAGLTGPMSVAGTVAQQHAEILACAVIAFLINKKAPVIYCARAFFANMKSTQVNLGLPETGIAGAIAVGLARHCGFLSDVYGLSSASYTYDSQIGYEKMLNGILPALCGGNFISGFGNIGSGMLQSLAQLVIDDEMFSMISKVIGSVVVDEDSLAEHVIGSVVAGEEMFITHDHTIEFLRAGELFQPVIGYQKSITDWLGEGKPDFADRALDRARMLIEKDEGVQLPRHLHEGIDEILKEAKMELGI